MRLQTALLTLWCGCLSLSAQAAVLHYGANEHQSEWQVEGSPIACRLTHHIPAYGTAIFERRAGEALGFRIEAQRQPRQAALARLVSAPPQWRHDTMVRDLGHVDIRIERATLLLHEPNAQRLLIELEHGMFPTFRFQDWSDGRDRVEVSLSAVRVRAAMREFLSCTEALLPYGFEEVRATRIAFETDKSELSREARRRLDQVAEYMLLDEQVIGLVLEGRADSRGRPRHNDALSERRAKAVRDYLQQRGVSEERFEIELHAYGERRPLATNRTAEGRALNRTVVVTLQGG